MRDSIASRIERLRRDRAPAPNPQDMGSALRALARELRTTARAVGEGAEAWEAACPPELAGRCVIEGVRRRVLQIRPDDAPTRFAVDRWLRGGGEDAVVEASRNRLSGVRLTRLA